MSETNGDAGADQLTISPHDGSRYPGRGWRGGAFPRSPLDPPACNGHSVPAYLFGPRRSRSIVAAQPFAFLTVRDGFGVAPNSAPDKVRVSPWLAPGVV